MSMDCQHNGQVVDCMDDWLEAVVQRDCVIPLSLVFLFELFFNLSYHFRGVYKLCRPEFISAFSFLWFL